MIRHIKSALKRPAPYHMSHLTGDLTAGMIVTFLLIPQSMAYANLAGVPVTMGLYASAFPLIIYAIFGSSRYLSVGPVSIASLLTLTGLSGLAVPRSEPFLQLVVLLSLLVGTIQLLMGLFKFGSFLQYVSSGVINGFISALAFIIIGHQLPSLLGVPRPVYNHFSAYIVELINALPKMHLLTALVGLASLLFLWVVQKTLRASPGPFIVFLTSIVLVDFFQLNQKGVAIVGRIPRELPHIALSVSGWDTFLALVPLAFVIAFISFFESFSVAQSLADRKQERLSANRELAGLGFANITSFVVGTIPVSGAISRTAVNYASGAKTKLSVVFSALFMLVLILYMTSFFYYLSKATLAAIIIFAVFNLIHIRQLTYYLKHDLYQAVVFLATLFTTFMIGIIQGLLIGIIVSAVIKGTRVQ